MPGSQKNITMSFPDLSMEPTLWGLCDAGFTSLSGLLEPTASSTPERNQHSLASESIWGVIIIEGSYNSL